MSRIQAGEIETYYQLIGLFGGSFQGSSIWGI